MSVEIVFQDDQLLVVNKPPNLLSVPGLVSDQNLFDLVRSDFPNARVVHRLDMATSGLILFALNYNSQKTLGKAFEAKQVQKTYLAEISGRPQKDSGIVCAPLICDWPNRPKQIVDWQSGKKAVTRFEVIQRFDQHSLVKLYPVTGRSHQLRVHCQYLGHPILGDTLYHYAHQQDHHADVRLRLHAHEIAFAHPITGEFTKLSCAVQF